ncbi:MAG: hypothetical protein SFV24_18080 [Gemmatimonadales bacterium]|nr:hypothetical protein [Gemmatimonadales bacterium]
MALASSWARASWEDARLKASEEATKNLRSLCSLLHLAHLAAAFGAATAHLGTAIHLLAADALAGLGAGLADLGAGGAYGTVMWRVSVHEVCSGHAGLDAVGHQLYVLGFGVLPAHHEAMVIEGVLAEFAAFLALFDTIFHPTISVVHK